MNQRSHISRLSTYVLALAMVFTMLFGAIGTRAANYTEQTLTMTLYDSEPISVPNASITGMSSSNSNIVSVKSYTSSSGTVYAQGVGSAYIYVTVTNSSGNTDNYTIPVTVSSSSSSSSSNSTTIAVNGTHIIGMFSNVINYYSTNPSIANVSLSGNVLSVIGLSSGSCTITYSIRNTSGNLESYSLYVTVTGYSTPTPTPYSTSSPSTGSVLQAGKRYVTSATYYSIESVSVDNTNIATASSDSLGRIVIDAKSAGSTTIRFTYKTSSTSTTQSDTLSITVTGTSSNTPTPTQSGTSVSGIAFKSYNVNVKINRSYKIGTIYLNGSTISPERLLWVSNDPDIITVNPNTGVFKCVGTGSCKLIAIDTSAQYMNSITVNVTN